MAHWLTRTAQNEISGPWTEEEVCSMILDGKFSLQDEACPANGYWFYLHETEEVARQLGVQVPLKRHKDEDTTQTETAVDQDLTDPEGLVRQPEQSVTLPRLESRASKPQDSPASSSETVARAAIVAQALGKKGVIRAKFEDMEKQSVWRGIAIALVLGVAVVVFAVLKLLKS